MSTSPLGVANPDRGHGWQRVRWCELAVRLGGSLHGHDVPPCFPMVPGRGVARQPDSPDGGITRPVDGLQTHRASCQRRPFD